MGKLESGWSFLFARLFNSTPSYIRVAVDKEGNLKKGTKYHFIFSVDRKISAADSNRVLSWLVMNLFLYIQ